MQQDGNLVLYDPTGTATWSSGTHGAGDSATLTSSCSLVVGGRSFGGGGSDSCVLSLGNSTTAGDSGTNLYVYDPAAANPNGVVPGEIVYDSAQGGDVSIFDPAFSY